MRVEDAASIEDLRKLARRRVPRFAFDFLDGGAEGEANLRRNASAFAQIELRPRYLVDVAARDTAISLFGRDYAVPFGMAPVGLLNLVWPGADRMIARLAARERMPYLVSSASSTVLEELAELAGGNAWFQLYVAGDDGLTDDLLRRARAAGCENLVLTVDVAVPGKRDRDIRNRFNVPFRLSPRVLAQLARCPHWTWRAWRAGAPGPVNLQRYAGAGTDSQSLAQMQAAMIDPGFDWDALSRLRERWPGRLLLKGILHPADAREAVSRGCDGVIVSNHGGRQADYAPPAIEALPAVARELDGAVPVLLDSGVRRGADVIRARALGAECVFLGRAFGYGLGAGAERGAARAFEIIRLELDRALGQLGRPRFVDVDATLLANRGQSGG